MTKDEVDFETANVSATCQGSILQGFPLEISNASWARQEVITPRQGLMLIEAILRIPRQGSSSCGARCGPVT